MMILFIRRDGHLGHHEVFHQETIQIGRAASNDLVLDHFLIDAHHATVFADDGLFAVESRTGKQTYVSNKGELRLRPFVVELEQFTDPTEVTMLSQLEAGDDVVRAVYADWLEEHAELPRAQLLRTQAELLAQAPRSPAFDALSERLYALAARVPAGWRSCVARPAIAIGDPALEFGLGFARNARRIGCEPYVILQLTIGGERLAATEVFVPRLVAELEWTLADLRRLPELPTPLLDKCAPAGVSVQNVRHGDDAVIAARRNDVAVETRLPVAELRDRIGRVLAILADS